MVFLAVIIILSMTFCFVFGIVLICRGDGEGILFFIMVLPLFLILCLIGASYQENIDNWSDITRHQKELDNQIYVIKSIESQELSNEKIKSIQNEIAEYNNLYKHILTETSEHVPDCLPYYNDYTYLQYDYVTNTVVPKEEN